MANFNKLQFKRGTATQWATDNPILSSGEPGFDVTNYILKVGDGVNPWSTLPDIYSDNTPGITALLDDTSPQLGANLDLNTYLVSGVGGINVTGNTFIDGNLDVTGITTVHHIDSVTTLAVSGDITTSGNIIADSNIIAPAISGDYVAGATMYGEVAYADYLGVTEYIEIANSGYIQFPVVSNGDIPAHSEGIIYYDEDTRSLTVYNDEADIALNLGQEFYVRVRNNSGGTILNGQPVYITGAHGGAAPTVELASASGVDSAHVEGIATHDIEDATFGYITTAGRINGLNTSFFSEGDELYLAASGNGILTNVAPAIPNYEVAIGHVVRSHASNGIIIATPRNPKLGGGDMKANETPDLNGVPFVAQVAGTAGGLETDPLFTYDEANSKLDVQKIKSTLVMRAYANLATVPSPETWEVVFSTTDNLPVWYDGAVWRDFAGNAV